MDARLVQYLKVNQYHSPYYQAKKEKGSDPINWSRKKHLKKIQHQLLIKTLREIGIEGNFFSLIVYKNFQQTSYLLVTNWMLFP